MEIFTITFFGHRDFNAHFKCEEKLNNLLTKLMTEKEYVEFLVGRNGEFDIFASSKIREARKKHGNHNSSLTLVLPYLTAEYNQNQKEFEKYYDEIEICAESSSAHYKAAIQIRNKKMVDRADLIICYIERKSGGAFQAVKHAEKSGKQIINIAE